MGYWTKPDMVTENEKFFEAIERVVLEEGKNMEIPLMPDMNSTGERFRLREILAATTNHPFELEGRFAGLADKVRLLNKGDRIVITAKKRSRTSHTAHTEVTWEEIQRRPAPEISDAEREAYWQAYRAHAEAGTLPEAWKKDVKNAPPEFRTPSASPYGSAIASYLGKNRSSPVPPGTHTPDMEEESDE